MKKADKHMCLPAFLHLIMTDHAVWDGGGGGN